MAGAALALGVLGSVAGGFSEAQNIRAEGDAQSAALEFEAEQLDRRGKEEFAAGQQQAQEARLKKRLALSQLQTRAAASGFSATEGDVLDIATDIDERGTFQADLFEFGGALQRENLDNNAAARRASASNVRAGAKMRANSAELSGLTGGFQRFAAGISPPSGGGASTGSRFRYG